MALGIFPKARGAGGGRGALRTTQFYACEMYYVSGAWNGQNEIGVITVERNIIKLMCVEHVWSLGRYEA